MFHMITQLQNITCFPTPTHALFTVSLSYMYISSFNYLLVQYAPFSSVVVMFIVECSHMVVSLNYLFMSTIYVDITTHYMYTYKINA